MQDWGAGGPTPSESVNWEGYMGGDVIVPEYDDVGGGGGILPALIQGGAGMIGAGINASAQEAANQTNIQLARENQAFQERMSSSAYQRAMRDMQLAGLNPMLAFSQGGASSPSGSLAQVEAVNAGDAIKAAGATAKDVAAFNMEMKQKTAELQLAKAATAAKITEADLNQHTAKNVDSTTERQNTEIKILKKKLPAIAAESKNQVKQADIDNSMMGFDNIVHRAGKTLGVITDAFNPVRWFKQGLSPAKPSNQREADIYRSGVSRGRSEYRGKK